MKTNRPTQKKRAGKKRQKKAVAPLFTEIEGTPYTGVLNEQTWNLSKATWNESRRNAKSWDILFETLATKPFEGANELPVGSEFHSYILAHQTMVKTRKNTWKVKLDGKKFKLAHKEEGAGWSANSTTRRNYLIKILKETLHELEMGHGPAPSHSKTPFNAGTASNG
ncbi:MAG TPA: hypothetical protein VK177_21530 [Flavobacteriales bacterium]|nr:hypothetical protein [Flavobacteriales bacterium]